MTREATLPEAAESAIPRRWHVALFLAAAAVFAGWFGPIQILLPAQALAIAGPDGKEGLLALVTGIGAVVSLIANPLWGIISDRLSATVPRRRPVRSGSRRTNPPRARHRRGPSPSWPP